MISDIQAIRKMCSDFLTRPKLVVIPSMNLKNQVYKSLNDAGIAPVNLEVSTVQELAMKSTMLQINKNNLSLLNDNDIAELVRIVYERLYADQKLNYFAGIEATTGLYKSISRTVVEMKYAGWNQGNVDLSFMENIKKRGDIDQIINEYNEMLKKSAYIDMADVIMMAYETSKLNIRYDSIHVMEGCSLGFIEEHFLHILGWEKTAAEDAYLIDYKSAMKNTEVISLVRTYCITYT